MAAPVELVEALLYSFDTNDRINHFLIRALPAEVWRLKHPNGKGREIASIVAHMHNVRLMWLKSAGKTNQLPAKLEAGEATPETAIAALTESCAALRELLHQSLSTDSRIKGFKPDRREFPRVSVCPRCAPSRTDLHARPPIGPPHFAKRHVRHVGVGHTLTYLIG